MKLRARGQTQQLVRIGIELIATVSEMQDHGTGHCERWLVVAHASVIGSGSAGMLPVIPTSGRVRNRTSGHVARSPLRSRSP